MLNATEDADEDIPWARPGSNQSYMLSFSDDHGLLRDEDELEEDIEFPADTYAYIAWYDSQQPHLRQHYPYLEQLYRDSQFYIDPDRRANEEDEEYRQRYIAEVQHILGTGPLPKANASAQTSSDMENHPPVPLKARPAGRPPPAKQPSPAIAPPALAAHHNFYVG
eukprot:968943-Karenia_brevis.AAC.1